MYSVLLVDDEEATRSSIRNFTPWEEYGFENPREASNGLEALELIDETMPDVIITDIKMPYLDGIELTRRIRSEYSSTALIVILSGYDEFTFAQEAVKLRVSEYVLKPVNVDSMKELLARLKKRLDEDRERFAQSSQNEEVYKEAFSLYKERFFIYLITSRSKEKNNDELIKQASFFGLSPLSQIFAIAAIEPLDDVAFPNTLEKIGKAAFEDANLTPIVFQYESQIVLLFSSSMDSSFIPLFKKQVYRALSLLKESISHYFKHKFHIGVGSAVTELGSIPSSYRGAVEALNYSALYPEQYIIDVKDVESVEHENSEASLGSIKSDLILAIKYGTKEDVINTVHSCFANMPKNSDVQSMVLFILGNISEIWSQYSKKLSELAEEENLFSQLQHINSLASGEKFCISVALKANELTNGTRETSHIQFVENAKKIIIKRYSDPLFGLDALCDEISVSPAYFSTTFKKETGISFVQFLTNTRLEKAKEMLKSSEKKSYEIAEAIGFSEPNYFSFIFKKNVGMSPSQYRGSFRK